MPRTIKNPRKHGQNRTLLTGTGLDAGVMRMQRMVYMSVTEDLLCVKMPFSLVDTESRHRVIKKAKLV